MLPVGLTEVRPSIQLSLWNFRLLVQKPPLKDASVMGAVRIDRSNTEGVEVNPVDGWHCHYFSKKASLYEFKICIMV